jgi:hypothetical protein
MLAYLSKKHARNPNRGKNYPSEKRLFPTLCPAKEAFSSRNVKKKNSVEKNHSLDRVFFPTLGKEKINL